MARTKKSESISQKNKHLERNPGMPLELDWIKNVYINKSAIERRVNTLPSRRSIKKQWQVAWLLRAISCLDLTTLSSDDTDGNVERLCVKGLNPVRRDILEGFGVTNLNLTVGAICVYHNMIPKAVSILGDKIPVAAVSTGFPAGQNPFKQRIEEITESVKAGAKEIDIVITRGQVLKGEWDKLYTEVTAYREACGDAHMKTILGTGELGNLRNVYKASMICMMAGADFIKTSTGKESVNATLPVGLTMVRAIREYYENTGYKVGFKPAGGIKVAKDALVWLSLMKEELGDAWMEPELFRFGASSLLGDIERQLEHNLSGSYSASYRHPMS
ncbi:MAG: deoxyribose-phosphate aldolase [Candidatus Heimdallarchaeota archaeon]|nr:deoxyribose-phosphate aldolase [Candidatus Heimdallarchaeota archaeon]MDH5644448.1 deoxyribose-phosphate aldolase [Candidatus Heimdallarchaeota archaeon]